MCIPRRFVFLIGIVALLGIATNAFGNEPKVAPYITREGAVAILVESRPEWKAELDAVRQNIPPLLIHTDTPRDAWYVPYLEVAFNHGLVVATDFHREFRPGELLRQGDAIALAVRYRANGDKTQIPQEEPDHPLSIPLHVQKGYDMNLDFPEPLETWNVIRRTQWFDLIRSAGVANPEAIVVTIPPAVPTIPQPTFPPEQPQLPVTGPTPSPVYYPPSGPGTGYKPDEEFYPTTPTAPTYVPNPPGSQPISSNQGPVSQPVTSNPSNLTTTPAANNAFTVTIPTLGRTFNVTHPTDVVSQAGLLAPLQTGVGHLFSYPGQGGTVLIYGHSSSIRSDPSEFTKAFREINKLNQGDLVYVTRDGKTYTYQVTFKHTVPAEDMSAYQQGNGEELILYTCWPPDDIKQRYLVHAKPI